MGDAILRSYMSNLLNRTGKDKGSNSLKRKGGAPKGTAGGKKRKTAETKISIAKPRKAVSKKVTGKNEVKVGKPKNKATDRMTVSKKGNTLATMCNQKNGAVSKKVTGKNQAKVGKPQKEGVPKEGVVKDAQPEALAMEIRDKWPNLGRQLTAAYTKLRSCVSKAPLTDARLVLSAIDRMTASKKGNTQATMSNQKNGGTKKMPAQAAKPPKKRVEWVLKEGVVKDEQLEALAMDISDKWTNLGRRLNIEQSKLQAITKDFDSVHERAFQMLKHWKQKQGSGASYKSLSAALKHNLIERKDLAEKYCFKRQ